MSEEFRAVLRDVTEAEIRKQARGRFRLFRAATDETLLFFPDHGKRSTRAAWGTAVAEAGDRFTPEERQELLANRRLPTWFWPWVKDQAKYWKDVQDGRQ